jgi:hypothetical protein
MDAKIYATTRAVLRALLVGRQIYGVDYDGFYESLDELFDRPETAAHFAQFQDAYRKRRTSRTGKWIAANIKYIARDVLYKYQSRYKGGTWPPVVAGEVRGRWRTINPPQLTDNDIAMEGGDNYSQSNISSASVGLPAPKLIKLIIVDPETCMKLNPAVKDAWRFVDPVNCYRVITVTSLTFLHLVERIKPQLPVGRTVRTVYGSMTTPTAANEPGESPEQLVPLDSDDTVQGYLLAASIIPPWILVVLRRPPPADDDIPRPPSPPPTYHELDDDLFQDEEEPLIYPHSDSDADEDTVRRRFTPPRTILGFLKAIDKVGRSMTRQVEYSKRLQEAARRKNFEGRLCFPHERCYRRNMGADHHQRIKRKYDALGRVESYADHFTIWRSENPIESVDVDGDGNMIDEDGNVIPDPDATPEESSASDSEA